MDGEARIEVTCAQCGRQLGVPREALGKRGRCPHCKETIQLPAEDAIEGLESEPEAEEMTLPGPSSEPEKLSKRKRREVQPEPEVIRVKVVDVDIPFGSMFRLVGNFLMASFAIVLAFVLIVLLPVAMVLLSKGWFGG